MAKSGGKIPNFPQNIESFRILSRWCLQRYIELVANWKTEIILTQDILKAWFMKKRQFILFNKMFIKVVTQIMQELSKKKKKKVRE